MRLSVIIPVYKTPNTLDRCVRSVLGQNVDGMEVILVDDGSPDECPAKCDDWAARDSRIMVVHKENGGLSDARNSGLEHANGEYVAFVDSDDWLERGTYGPLLERLAAYGDCDILEFSLRHIGESGRQPVVLDDRIFPSARRYWEKTRAWNHAYACNKVIRRSLFQRVRFPKGKFFEDIYTLPLLLEGNPRVATTAHGCYCYEWNGAGISAGQSRTVEGLRQHLEALRLAAVTMRTPLLSGNGSNLYYAMLCRQVDLYRITGEIHLRWPLVRLVCWLHKRLKGK